MERGPPKCPHCRHGPPWYLNNHDESTTGRLKTDDFIHPPPCYQLYKSCSWKVADKTNAVISPARLWSGFLAEAPIIYSKQKKKKRKIWSGANLYWHPGLSSETPSLLKSLKDSENTSIPCSQLWRNHYSKSVNCDYNISGSLPRLLLYNLWPTLCAFSKLHKFIHSIWERWNKCT